MSASTAHTIIRAAYGRGSAQDTRACIMLARGRAQDVIAQAYALQGQRRGRNLSIAA